MLKIIKNRTEFKELSNKKYLFYLDTGLTQIYEPVTFKGLCRYIMYKIRRGGVAKATNPLLFAYLSYITLFMGCEMMYIKRSPTYQGFLGFTILVLLQFHKVRYAIVCYLQRLQDTNVLYL